MALDYEEWLHYDPWREEHAHPSNPKYVAAEILKEMHEPVRITPALDEYGQVKTGIVLIEAGRKPIILLNRIRERPETKALYDAATLEAEPNTRECYWDIATQRRVKALYFINLAQLCQDYADEFRPQDPQEALRWEIQAIGAQGYASLLLEWAEANPLTEGQFHMLIRNIVLQENNDKWFYRR